MIFFFEVWFAASVGVAFALCRVFSGMGEPQCQTNTEIISPQSLLAMSVGQSLD